MLLFVLKKYQKMFQSQIVYAQNCSNDEIFKLLELKIEHFDDFCLQ